MTQPSSDVQTSPMPQPPDVLPPAVSPAPLTPADIALLDPVAMNKRFRENRDAFPEEQLAAYAGQLVAWWPDGSRIFDADASGPALFRRLRDAGYLVSFFMIEPIPRPDDPEVDPYTELCKAFSKNRNNFPAEELMKYGGKVVAWWRDGSRIVDADIDGMALRQRLRDAGHDMSYFVLEYIRSPDETYV